MLTSTVHQYIKFHPYKLIRPAHVRSAYLFFQNVHNRQNVKANPFTFWQFLGLFKVNFSENFTTNDIDKKSTTLWPNEQMKLWPNESEWNCHCEVEGISENFKTLITPRLCNSGDHGLHRCAIWRARTMRKGCF